MKVHQETCPLLTFGGLAIDRVTFRELLPDYKWYVYAAGIVYPGDTNTATLTLAYQKDDATYVSLGTTTKTGASWSKFTIGPLDVFATASVPSTESVVIVRFQAAKNTGVDGLVEAVCIWTRFLPARQ